jgi:hypothetical protein
LAIRLRPFVPTARSRKVCDRNRLSRELYVASSASVNVESKFTAALCMTAAKALSHN